MKEEDVKVQEDKGGEEVRRVKCPAHKACPATQRVRYMRAQA